MQKRFVIFAAMKSALGIVCACFAALFVSACGGAASEGTVPEAAPSVYYWRTTLRLDSAERAFLREHRIGKIYLRFFDVAVREGRAVPTATLHFDEPLPDSVQAVPVVFLTEECLHADTTELAGRLVERVAKMARANGLENVCELQLDCDWASSSRTTYFALLADVRERLRQIGWRLSVTIRLHQLAQPAPPADYGVLMLYNTGDFRRRDGHNPILDERDVEPFLRRLPDYALPLCAAYPDYRWQLLFEDGSFRALLYDENLADSLVYAPLAGDSLYRVVSARTLHGALQSDYDVHLVPGQEVVVHRSRPDVVLRLRQRLESLRPGLHAQTILYHLDSRYLNNFNANEYEKLFHD